MRHIFSKPWQGKVHDRSSIQYLTCTDSVGLHGQFYAVKSTPSPLLCIGSAVSIHKPAKATSVEIGSSQGLAPSPKSRKKRAQVRRSNWLRELHLLLQTCSMLTPHPRRRIHLFGIG